MKEYPIIFTGESVRAIRAGRKTQTRRVVTNAKPYTAIDNGIDVLWYTGQLGSPYGNVGDRLWVRETWARHVIGGADHIVYRADCGSDGDAAPWRSSRFMPRAYARILLTVTFIRVERVQDITHDDCVAEGMTPRDYAEHHDCAQCWYADVWRKLNDARGYGWDVNPWVWVIGFEEAQQ